ncbi:hypothetical protein KQ51_00063 [Candidatus Izimaplasma bacterium HR1]|jgi:hypothetical protein|uniref:hypothetical protein n=1 Tax=Candidatus Izimoplasma sp. HR1 TaxID=1541959 RepID=UPI0004F8C340|nr:hypothetical protein KQ51_00063 [Candidatus Izimaplasma bacterium HR1]
MLTLAISFVELLDSSFGGFINFFLGMVTGVVLFLLLVTVFGIRGKNLSLDAKKPEGEISGDDLKKLIEHRQTSLKRSIKLKNEGAFRLTFNMSIELVEEVSRYFFPNSKYPMFELSVNELLELNHYITDRINDILEVPILKNAKKMRIITIVNMYEKKRALEESKLAKAAKKYRFGKVLKYGGMALNAINPVYWFRKLVLSTSMDIIIRKLCVTIVAVVGEETAKVYSKKLFDQDLELGIVEKDMEDLLAEGDDEPEEAEES